MSDLETDLLTYLQRIVPAFVQGPAASLRVVGGTEVLRLLGLVEHLATVDAGYLGQVFGRPFPEPPPWDDEDAEPEADMWATAEESRAELLALYRRVWAHGDATVAALDLDATGTVPWWPAERRHPTLHRVLVHLIAETHRHAGHADVVRELVDGSVGMLATVSNLGSDDPAERDAHRARVQAAAELAAAP